MATPKHLKPDAIYAAGYTLEKLAKLPAGPHYFSAPNPDLYRHSPLTPKRPYSWPRCAPGTGNAATCKPQ